MNHTSALHNSIVRLLRQHLESMMDFRNLVTLAWMIFGSIMSKSTNRNSWAECVFGKAKRVRSTVRRFERFFDNDRIDMGLILEPYFRFLLSKAPSGAPLVIALDTTIVFGTLCMIRISAVYAGRAVPLVWKTLDQKSATVSFVNYEEMLDEVESILPEEAKVLFLADRGFCALELLRALLRRKWGFRIRIKGRTRLRGAEGREFRPNGLCLKEGWAHFWPSVSIGDVRGLSFAALDPWGSKERWYIIAEEGGVGQNVFSEYAQRFCIEESFLDEKSNGFDLEASRVRNTESLDRLIGVTALATVLLVQLGIEVLDKDIRKKVEPRLHRGSSILRLGWKTVKTMFGKDWETLETLLSLLVLKELDFEVKLDKVFVSARIDRERAMKKRKFSMYEWHTKDDWEEKSMDDLAILIASL